MLRRYVHGAGADDPLVWYEGSGTSDRRFLSRDERGSIIAVEYGAQVAVNAYDEYGVPRAGNLGRFQYTGQTWLSEFGLYHYKARAYHPALGRFLQTDPIGYADGTNLYAYVGNDPVNRFDPSGERCEGVGKDAQCTADTFNGKPIDELRKSKDPADAADKAALAKTDVAKLERGLTKAYKATLRAEANGDKPRKVEVPGVKQPQEVKPSQLSETMRNTDVGISTAQPRDGRLSQASPGEITFFQNGINRYSERTIAYGFVEEAIHSQPQISQFNSVFRRWPAHDFSEPINSILNEP